jgi:AcrR family transcriptional regulator
MRKNQNARLRKPEILENYYQVMIEEGIEGASIGKIAARMNIHPSLIIHYFKNKENMTLELVDFLIDKYEATEFLDFGHIDDPRERLRALMDTIFSLEWSRTVDPGLHFGFYYLSMRKPEIKKRFKKMIHGFRDYLADELESYRAAGVIGVRDAQVAADIIVILMEGLEFHAHFMAEGKPFEDFADSARRVALAMLKPEDGRTAVVP